MSQVRTALPVASHAWRGLHGTINAPRHHAPVAFNSPQVIVLELKPSLCAAVDRCFACAPLPAATLTAGAAGLAAPTPPTLPVVQRTAARTAPTLAGRTGCTSWPRGGPRSLYDERTLTPAGDKGGEACGDT